MPNSAYNDSTTLTALPSETVRRQFLRAAIFVDGNNWFHRLKELLNNSIDPLKQSLRPPFQFGLREFCTTLVAPNHVGSITYYKGLIKQMRGNAKSQHIYANEQRALKFLRDIQKINLVFGKVIQHPDGSFHEKGVDLRLAIDMIKGALANTYDIAYLISSDNDLHPAVEECRTLGKEVVYVGSSIKPSFGLQKVCSRSILLQQKDILPYMPAIQSPLIP